MDTFLYQVLRQIGNGERFFEPHDNSDDAKNEFTHVVNALRSLKTKNLITLNDRNILKDSESPKNHYDIAGPCDLTYEGTQLLKLMPSTPAISSLSSLISAEGLSACQADFNRAITGLADNPVQAIGNASSTLESICKAVLDKFKQSYPKDQSLQPLLKETFNILNLGPDKAAEDEVKRLLGGLLNAGLAIGVLRTKYSAAHGKDESQPYLSHVFARLAVNAMATIGLFLLEQAFK